MLSFATFAQAFSMLVVCWTIIAGIEQWRREFIGKRQIELAKQCLECFYEVKDAIKYIRNPWIAESDGSSREKSEHESEEETKLLNRGYIAIERYARKENMFAKFQSMKYRYMAGFGSDKEDIFTNIAIELNKVFTVSRTLATIYWKRRNQEFALSQNNIQFQEDKTQFEQILWELDPEKDSFVPVIKSAQMRLEAVLAACSRETTDSYRWLTKPWS